MPQIAEPKYPADVFMEFTSIDRFLYRVTDLYTISEYNPPDIVERLDNCHIYLLGKRPRLAAVPGSLRTASETIVLDVEYKIHGHVRRGQIGFPRRSFPPGDYDFNVSAYPHRELVSYDRKGEIVGYTLLANFAHTMQKLEAEAKDLEILYVGKGLRKSAQDRLEHHETLQKILAHVHSNEPDMEIFALVFAFKYSKNILAYKGVKTVVSGSLARERLKAAMQYVPTLDDQVSLIEASCISYFKTNSYNTHYLDFPKRSHVNLKPIYDAEFAAIIVNLDQSAIGNLRIFSKSVKSGHSHRIVIDFRKLEGSVSMLS